MTIGPGKYDELCTQAREEAQGEGAVLFILKGKRGTGFSVQGPLDLHKRVLDWLNLMTAGARADIADLTPSPNKLKHEAMRSLLEELRTARPLLLYGDAWIARIEEVLGMPDGK